MRKVKFGYPFPRLQMTEKEKDNLYEIVTAAR